MLVCRLLRDDTKKEILFQALNIIYRGKARALTCEEMYVKNDFRFDLVARMHPAVPLTR